MLFRSRSIRTAEKEHTREAQREPCSVIVCKRRISAAHLAKDEWNLLPCTISAALIVTTKDLHERRKPRPLRASNERTRRD